MQNENDHDLLIKVDQKLSDMWTYLVSSDKENKHVHAVMNKKLDAQQLALSAQKTDCSKTFLYSRTFWKVFAALMVLTMGSFAYTSGVLAYVLKYLAE